MNISNLKVGMIVKNYKEFCKLLEIEPRGSSSGSNTRKAQLKEIDRRVRYKKVEGSNKIEIVEIFSETKNKVDERAKGNNSKYVENIEKIVLHTLHNSNRSNGDLILSRGKLLEVCNMINENYREGKRKISKISAMTEIESDYIYNFYTHSNTMLSKSITSALKSLKNKRVIDYYDVIMLCEDITTPVITTNGEVEFVKTGEQVYREATDEERKNILKYEKEAIRMLGCGKIQDVVLKGKWKEFKELSEAMIRNMFNKNIDFYYSAYKLLYNAEDIADEISWMQLQENKNNLNDKVSTTLAKSTKTRHTKAVNNIDINKSKNKIMESKDDYISKQMTLLELLVKNNPKERV